MTKYIYSECPADYCPTIKSIFANSYDDAVEKLIEQYSNEFEDDEIAKLSEFKTLREYLNDTYTLVLSDLEDYETL